MSKRLDRLLNIFSPDSRSGRTSLGTPSSTTFHPSDSTPLLAADSTSQPEHPSSRKHSRNYFTESVRSVSSSRSFDNFSAFPTPITDDMSCDSMNESPGKTSWVIAAFLLINASLGAGLLNYPVAYNRLGGIALATVIQFFALILMATTMLTLVYCARLHNQNSYHGVMKTMCGKFVMQCSATSIAVTCFGICVTFLIIVGDQFDRLLATYIGDEFCSYWYANRYFTISIVAMFTMWPICYFRRLDFLRHINLLGVVASFYVIVLYIYNYYQRKSTIPIAPIIKTWPDSSIEFIASLPVVFFAYQTHEIVIPVHVSMKDKSMAAFAKTTALSLVVLFVLYCGAGTYGYLSYGQDVAADIMLMYDAHDPFVVCGIIALIIKMITTYPPVVFCGRDTIMRLLMSHERSKQLRRLSEQNPTSTNCPVSAAIRAAEEAKLAKPIEQTRRYKMLHLSTTSIWNIAVLVLALITPNITVAIGFLGSLASANVFIFPGLALIGLARQFRSIRKKYEDQQNETPDTPVRKKHGIKNLFANFRLENAGVQTFLTCYGYFIISMGVVMCFIILWQMTRDLRNPALSHELCKTNIAFH